MAQRRAEAQQEFIDKRRCCRYHRNIDEFRYREVGAMRQARERRWVKWLQRVEFCDGCGRVCTAGCRAAAARTAVVDRALTMGLPR
jgi:hypothetical protein